tara:strand:- start:210 stop:620 length:411 start_codon:yes stop_codon:yes gene_type:complete
MASNLVPGTGKHGTVTNPTGLAGSIHQNPPFSVEAGLTQAKSAYTTVTSSAPLVAVPVFGVASVSLLTTVSTKGDTNQSAVAVTGGTGSNATVSYTVTSNVASVPTVNVAGTGYSIGDVLTVTGDSGVTLTVQTLS